MTASSCRRAACPETAAWISSANSRASPRSGFEVSHQTIRHRARRRGRGRSRARPNGRRPAAGGRIPRWCARRIARTQVALVDVAGDQRRRMRVGAGDEQRRTPQTSAASRAALSVRMNALRRHENLAAEMAALLFRGELILEVDAGGARLDHRLHQLEGVERAAEAGFGVGDDRREPVGRGVALELWRSGRRAGSVLLMRRTTSGTDVGRIERLVGIHLAGVVGVGGDLPAGQVDRLRGRP